MLEKFHLISYIPKFDELLDPDFIWCTIWTIIKNQEDSCKDESYYPIDRFFVESYSFPKWFFDIDKNYSNYHEESFNWIVHQGSDIKELLTHSIKASNKDYYSFKIYNNWKISATLKHPYKFLDSCWIVSLFVFINKWNLIESYIFGEPLLDLILDPPLQHIPSKYNKKLSYRKLLIHLESKYYDV